MDRRRFAGVLLHAVGATACRPLEPSARVTVCGAAPSRPPAVRGRALRTRAVARVIAAARSLEGAGFPVRRPFPTSALALADPFVLLDELGPVRWAPGEARGAPDHPHRGFETVTYVLAGHMQHRDSLGNRGALDPGGVQWMTAGSGIVHAEMPADALVADGGEMHGFQLWVNLPAREKWVAPRYQNLAPGGLPVGGTDDGRVRARVIAGAALGARAAVETHTPIICQHWTLAPGAVAEQLIPADHAACALVFRGACALGDEQRAVRDGELALFGAGDRVRFAVPASANSAAEVRLLAGVPLGEPVARYGPFVMNTDDEVRRAFEDYRSGRMGRIPG